MLPPPRDGSRLGLGTRLGSEDPATDDSMCEIVRIALDLGVRLVDTAVNYRAGRSEAAVGRGLKQALGSGRVRREEVTVCTKGGFARPALPGSSPPPAPEEHGPFDHCFRPSCLRHQLELSLSTMGVDRIDVYYLHNPEEQHARSTPDGFTATMAGAFGVLEEAVAEGLVGSYGVSTWTGVRPGQGWSLESLKGLAARVAAEKRGVADHLTHVQGPLSIGMRDALAPAHPAPGGRLSFVALCSSLGLRYVASAAAGGGRVPALAATSVRWVTRVPGVDTALVGTLSPDHLAQMLS